ncbi:MAG: hypothetical protein E7589_03350 [Ruminococcaceae bacterium]|nr:hypothetical protein [Oscillospiraceae bacterium]
MANGYSRKKLWRHGSVSVGLTVTLVAVLILVNTVFSTLALRYSWFINMNRVLAFPVSDSCYDYLDKEVIPATDEKITVMFCMTKEDAKVSDIQKYIYATACELADKYPDKIEIAHTNIYENPSYAKQFGVNATSDVVVICGERNRVCNATDFFAFSASDNTTPTAYLGDRRFAVAMKAVTEDSTPMCYFTLNHGESLLDNEIMHTVVDAGYNVSYMDLLSYDVPDDCDLIIIYNPTRDLTVEDGASGISEIDKLDSFMSSGGKLAVFTSADTFRAGGFENLEGFLAKWGVEYRHKSTESGVEECAAVRDLSNSLTPDGYTFLADTSRVGEGKRIFEGIDGAIRLSNAGIIDVADGFVQTADGSFTSADSKRTLSTLLLSKSGAEAWAAGRATERTENGFALMTLTSSTDGSKLLACSSIDFASEDSMQNGVYANKDVLLSTIGAMGKDAIPLGIPAQPITDLSIRTMTTKTATTVTVIMTATPALIIFAIGAVVLIRRKYA